VPLAMAAPAPVVLVMICPMLPKVKVVPVSTVDAGLIPLNVRVSVFPTPLLKVTEDPPPLKEPVVEYVTIVA